MGLFRRKGPYDIDNAGLTRKPKREPLSPEKMAETRRLALFLIGNTFLSMLIYFGCVKAEFDAIMYIYVGVLAALALAYVIYNKGFVYRGATPEMLPDTLSPEEKQAILDGAEARMKKSKWMLLVMIPMTITLMIDVLYLFLLEDLFERMGVTLLIHPAL